MSLLYQELIHLALSLLAGFIVYRTWKKRNVFIFALFSGFFIDIDHWFDNWMAYGLNFDIMRFFTSDFFAINIRLYIFFHGWEYIVIFILLGYWIKKYREIFVVLALSLFFHLIFDVYSNNVTFVGYSVLYRIFTGF